MCAEASTVLRAVAADFFFNCWYLEIPSDDRIRHIPRCVHYHAPGFRVETFYEWMYISIPPHALNQLSTRTTLHLRSVILDAIY
jgi:hypothetical protein